MAGYGESYGGSFSSGYRDTSGKPGTADTAKKVATGVTTGALTGAAAGAAVGSVVPGIGTTVGAIVGGTYGAIKGLVSGITGHKKAKARYYKKLAATVQRQRESNSAYNQYLQMIRQTRIANARTVANAADSGLNYSTAFYGASSGIKSQSIYSIQYLGEDRRLQKLYNRYMKKAGKAQTQADTIQAGYDATESLSLSIISLGSSYKNLNTNAPDTTE